MNLFKRLFSRPVYSLTLTLPSETIEISFDSVEEMAQLFKSGWPFGLENAELRAAFTGLVATTAALNKTTIAE